MNILLVNHYAGAPQYGMEYRPYYFAREWVRQGHTVRIVGASSAHLRSRQPETVGSYTEEMIDGIQYVWLETPDYVGNGGKRVLNMLIFIMQLYRYAARVTAGFIPDVVIASSTYPLDIYPARYIAKKCRAKLVYEVHDLWPLSPMELGGMSPRHPFIMAMQVAENYAYQYADKVISLLPKAREHMIAHGMAADKFAYVPNGVVAEEWGKDSLDIPELHRKTLNELKNNNQFIVGYAGSHGLANALQYFLEAKKKIKDGNVVFVLVGDGAEKTRLQQITMQDDLKDIYFLPVVRKQEVYHILEFFDAAYIGWNYKPIYRFGVSPNKLFDYMMAGKPIIHSINAGNDLVAAAGCGISIPAENPAAIAQAILAMKQLSDLERERMGARGRAFVLANHDYKVLAERFINFIK